MDTKQIFANKLKQLMNDLGIKFYFGWEDDRGFIIDGEEIDLDTIAEAMPEDMSVTAKEVQEANEEWLTRQEKQ